MLSYSFRFAGIPWLAGVIIPAALLAAPPPRSPAASALQPFLKQNCIGCHSGSKPAGALDLQALSPTSIRTETAKWQRIVDRMKSGEMPPAPLPRPDPAQLKAIAAHIESNIDSSDRLAKPDPGRVTARRLNRFEYNNTIRDLLALDLDAAKDFPEDNSAYGFDNIGEALSIAPVQMEKYLSAAEKISRLAVFGPEVKRVSTLRIAPTLPRRMETNPVQLTEQPYFSPRDYDETGFAQPGSFSRRHRFEATGDYILRVFPNGTRPEGSEPLNLEIYLDGKLAQTFTVRESRTITNEVQPVAHEFRTRISAGYHDLSVVFPRLYEGLPPNYKGLNPSKLPQPAPPNPERFFPPLEKDSTPQQVAERNARLERFRARFANPVFNGVAVGIVEIAGPFEPVLGPLSETRAKVFICPEKTPACSQRIIASLARRAFRRPVAPDEAQGLENIAAQARQRGRSFDESIAVALQTILVSPDFLFRIENGSAAKNLAISPVGHFELASRLSYFLWASMPDEELLAIATSGRLSQPTILRAQTLRMLRDPKAQGMLSSFAGQWLETRRLEGVQPDRDRFPDFDENLKQAMMRETELFFANLAAKDGSIVDLVEGEYSFLNERLARHYKIPGVKGNEFRQVSLAGSGRAGILTHAGVLTVSSYNNRTSPVLRGKWILENLLNAPPPPPPPNVPALDEAAVGASGTLRQQMEKHRANAVCASCHARMDPLGFALENYNAVGQWRTQDGRFPIDASGALPDGRKIQGPQDLKIILAADREAFARTMSEKLLVYALGRGTQPSDRATIKQIARNAAANQYRFSSLILGVVNSIQFKMQKGPEPKS